MPSMKLTSALLAAACLAASSFAAPAGSASSSASAATQTAPYASENSNQQLWSPDQNVAPVPIRGTLGATILGPQNLATDLQNADLLAPPRPTLALCNGNAKWPFSLSHNRLQTGGWARQQNVKVMPIATEMAAVNMRLEAGSLRELHWHKTAEWAYVLKGNMSVSTVNQAGESYYDTIGPGDLWYFPPGVPHVLQATNDLPEGSEFLLVFDDGDFSEDSTFSLTDWLNHTPKSVLAKNSELSTPHLQRLQDDAAAEVTVEPGHIRELHWHPDSDEWSYFLEGNARVTLFASSANARTFNYQASNTGNTTLRFLEVFKSDKFEDISLGQWLALSPPELVKDHLQLDDATIARLNTTKVFGPSQLTG
ncbi:RmlC-like cupin domain-containing protein [Irpex lacteus]|nr:RmlC-like cupin domain-containing protein [Irpex lacteus]